MAHPRAEWGRIAFVVLSRTGAVVGVVAAVLFCWWRAQGPSTDAPHDPVHRNDGWVDESRCSECHTEPELFAETGHARTLTPARSDASLALLKSLAGIEHAEGIRIAADAGGVCAIHESDGRTQELHLDWCFGSGEHARTWVGTLTDSWGATDLVEFRWTWYDSIDGFAVTPGQPEQGVGGYFDALGVLHDHPKTRRCFACHASYLPVDDGRLDESELKPGVTCQRCHGPRKRHVETAGAIKDSFWREASQMESVNRCAECHRRADEQRPGDIRPDNADIVRFQPVGLVQSACFQASPEMTCMTCHDPHRPLEAQDSLGIWQCVQCHDSAHEGQTMCGAGHLDDCLRCHMPKVPLSAPLQFTDHWIRIRKAE